MDLQIQLRQLEYFVAAVETGSFTAAAERCKVTQPSLSQQIIKLEGAIGRQLFERRGRSIVLTDVGEVLYPRARAILSDLEQAKYAIKEGYAPERGELSVGIIPTLGPYVLHNTISAFKEYFPDAKLTVLEDMTNVLIAKLLSADLDVCYLSLPIDNTQIVTETLFTEDLYIVAPNGHKISEEAVLNLSMLGTIPFIKLTDSNCLTEQFDAFCYVKEINPPVLCETTQLATAIEFVRLQMGISLIPDCAQATYEDDQLTFLRIEGDAPTRDIVAAYHRARDMSVLAQQFSTCLKTAWRTAVKA